MGHRVDVPGVVQREHPAVAGPAHPRPRHRRRQTGHEIQRLERHVRGAVPEALATLAGQAFALRGIELVAHPAPGRQRQASTGNDRPLPPPGHP